MTDLDRRFETFYREHSGLVYNFLFRFLGSPEDAEDATVETFRRVHAGLGGLRGGHAAERTWTLRIATNVAVRAIQRRSRGATVSLDVFGGDHNQQGRPVSSARTDEVIVDKVLAEELLSRLPAKHRAAVWLRVGLQQTDQEVARILKVPVGTVKAWVWRSLAKLRQACKEVAVD